ncbi:14640_t:CDS:2 [Ambispora leptoticha]|uniref:14640_t:CDS:1 n=1 Tax=Ambispora leptoticha TaxID=144679 RepID=A0A9N9BC07_9GLOM|nr:14640_t:CDS:2 [Ambispora leptoticha]
MSPELFKTRIQRINEIITQTRAPRIFSFTPFLLLVTIISSPIIVSVIMSVLRSSSQGNDSNSSSPSKLFSAYLYAFSAIFACYIVGFFLFIKRFEVKQNKAINKQLEIFNIIDNPNQLNWRIEVKFEKDEGSNSMLMHEKKLVLDIMTSYSTIIQLQFPEATVIDINKIYNFGLARTFVSSNLVPTTRNSVFSNLPPSYDVASKDSPPKYHEISECV